MSAQNRRRVAVAFGAILREARDRSGVLQEQLAEGAEMDRTYPSLLERGRRQPTLCVLLNLAAALEVEPGLLVTMTVARLRSESS
jgi:transcriptional regulator with XRE-family HTH domain